MHQNKCVSLKHEQQLVKHNDLNHKGLVQYKWGTKKLTLRKNYGANIMTKQFEFELCKFELLTSVI